MSAITSILKPLLPQGCRRFLRDRLVRFNVKHLSGPPSVTLSEEDVVVTCLVKNGEFYLEQFIAHYTQLGVRHILLLDNGSTDRTITIARSHPNVSLWSSSLSVGSHQGLLQRFLTRRTQGRGWCVNADIDEFLAYPGSERISLREFIRYLNSRRFTAVVTQMLDMFADQPLSCLYEMKPDVLAEVYRFFDISNITCVPYFDSELTQRFGSRNRLSHPDSTLYYGGVRKPLYGAEWYTNCLLTKHSLFRLRSGLTLFDHVHFVDHAHIADVSCALLHYKLVSNVLMTATQNRKNFHHMSAGHNNFLNYLLDHPDRHLTSRTSREWNSASTLVDLGFLFASERFKKYLDTTHSGSDFPQPEPVPECHAHS